MLHERQPDATTNEVGRPREHNESEAREQIKLCFWRAGYTGTTIADLEAAAGVDRRQLFRDYDNKRGLFLTALDDFTTSAGERFLARLEAEQVSVDDIGGVLDDLADIESPTYGRLGCLVCSTVGDRTAMADVEIAARVEAYLERIEDAYQSALSQLDRGSSTPEQNRRSVARQLLGSHVAILVLGRSGASAETLRDIVDGAKATVRSHLAASRHTA